MNTEHWVHYGDSFQVLFHIAVLLPAYFIYVHIYVYVIAAVCLPFSLNPCNLRLCMRHNSSLNLPWQATPLQQNAPTHLPMPSVCFSNFSCWYNPLHLPPLRFFKSFWSSLPLTTNYAPKTHCGDFPIPSQWTSHKLLLFLCLWLPRQMSGPATFCIEQQETFRKHHSLNVVSEKHRAGSENRDKKPPS